MLGNKKFNMSSNEANETLKNVFEACNREPVNTSFHVLKAKGLAQTTMVSACKWIATAMIFIILVIPVALMNNDIKIESHGAVADRVIIVDHALYTDRFILTVVGEDIAFHDIYAKTADGTIVFPAQMNITAGTIEFPYNNESMTIYIPDKKGQVLTATLSDYTSDKVYVPEPDNKD